MLASHALIARVSAQRREFMAGSIAALMVLAVVLVARLGESLGPVDPPTVARSLVILPFRTTTSDPGTSILSYGIADQLSRALASVPGLRVAPATSPSLANTRSAASVRALASLLNVGAVVQGTVSRAGEELRVTLRITGVDGRTTVLATFTGDTTRLHELETRMATAVAAGLRTQPGLSQATVNAPTRDGRAHALAVRAAYLRWRAGAGTADLDSAIALLREAVKRDSAYARAWSALASVLATRSAVAVAAAPDLQRAAVDAAQRAILLDSALAEPHVALAHVHAAKGDTSRAARDYLSAIRADPRSSRARYEYSRLLLALGEIDEALREARRAHELDPLSPEVHMNLAEMLAGTGQQAHARQEMAELRRIKRYLSSQ